MNKKNENLKEDVFKIIQTFLKEPPLIVWGSGATIPFGLPTMSSLNETLKKEIKDFDSTNNNLENELCKGKYQKYLPQIKDVIWNKINEADIDVLNRISENDTSSFSGVKLLIEKFIEAHPQVLNIVTTNYDRTLEYIMAYESISFTDGFEGKNLSVFDECLFKGKNIVNLIKVHGSLNWFNFEGNIRYLNIKSNKHKPQIIIPGKNKYMEAYERPYRELIQRADNVIKVASSFLVIGFGFNDRHLTPKIKAQVKKGIPIVLITKKITSSALNELRDAEKYVLLEQIKHSTKVIYKTNRFEEEQEVEIEGNYWELSKFMEII